MAPVTGMEDSVANAHLNYTQNYLIVGMTSVMEIDVISQQKSI